MHLFIYSCRYSSYSYRGSLHAELTIRIGNSGQYEVAAVTGTRDEQYYSCILQVLPCLVTRTKYSTSTNSFQFLSIYHPKPSGTASVQSLSRLSLLKLDAVIWSFQHNNSSENWSPRSLLRVGFRNASRTSEQSPEFKFGGARSHKESLTPWWGGLSVL